jgi:3-hydroxyisobutyrate dehydrogenase-like beta-hydroxyacid dehydrogenase
VSEPGRPLNAVGVVGVGALGVDVARALVASGADVVVHDVRRELAELISGASVAASLAELAASVRTISIVVRDDVQVLEVVDVVSSHAEPGTVLLVHSTVSVDTVRAAGARAEAAGLALLDAGLCRPAALQSGLVALVGGPNEIVDSVRPVLNGLADGVHHLGPLGSGMVMKAMRNAVLYSAYAAVGEAIDIGRGSGLDVPSMIDAMVSTGTLSRAGRAFLDHRESWAAQDAAGTGDLAPREGFADLARKDLRIAVEIAAAAGLEAAFAAAVSTEMGRAYLAEPRS